MIEVKAVQFGIDSQEFVKTLDEIFVWLHGNLNTNAWMMTSLVDNDYLSFDFDYEEDAIAFKLKFGL